MLLRFWVKQQQTTVNESKQEHVSSILESSCVDVFCVEYCKTVMLEVHAAQTMECYIRQDCQVFSQSKPGVD